MDSINSRIKSLISALEISQNAFAKALNTSSSLLSNVVNDRNKPSFDILSAINEVYRNVNPDWLLTGRGEMFRNVDSSSTVTDKNVPLISTTKSTSISKSENLGVQNILTALQEPRNDYGLVPIDIVDVRAAANWEGLSMHDGVLETLGTVALSTKMLQRGKIHKGFPVIGDSMVPTIVPGDYIIARFLEKNEYQDIRDGYVHLISTSSGVVVKRILNRLAERGHLWARSDNKDYVPYAIEEQDIVSIWEVKARLTFQLDDGQADIKNGYNELRARMEEIEYLLKHHKK